MKSYMQKEISEQPDIIEKKIDYWTDSAKRIRYLIEDKQNIVLLGRGTSGNACIFASYLFGLTTGRHPIDFRPWLSTQETPLADWSDSVVLAYTQSGESSDIVHSAEWLSRRGAKVIAVTNSQNKMSSISKVANETFYLDVGEELAVPATKTFSAQLFATAALAGLDIKEAAFEISKAMRDYLNSNVPKKLNDFIISKSVIIWLARGLIQPAALDASLKLQETVGISSFGWSSAEFLHGPVASLNENDCVIIFDDNENQNIPDSESKIINILSQKKVEYYKLSDKPGDKVISLSLPKDKWAKTILYSFIGQHVALTLAEKKGLNPDKPHGLKKVTLT